MKDKIKKLVRVYKNDPFGNEGQTAYKKALELINKYGYKKSDFGIEYSLATKTDNELVVYEGSFKVKDNKTKQTLKSIVKTFLPDKPIKQKEKPKREVEPYKPQYPIERPQYQPTHYQPSEPYEQFNQQQPFYIANHPEYAKPQYKPQRIKRITERVIEFE